MGRKFVDLAVFRRFRSKFNLGKPPALPGAILRGPKNRFLRCPARKKVLERPLNCPKTAHKHCGTLPWDPWSTGGPSKSNFVNFALFCLTPSQNALPNAPNGARGVFLRPQNRSPGVPAGNQVLGCLLQCPRTPHNHYGTPPWGPSGTRGAAKSKKSRNSPVSGSTKKAQVKKPSKIPKTQKIEIPPK